MRLIIVGAGGCSREVLQWAKDINRINKRWDEFAFLDKDTDALRDKRCEERIIGEEDTFDIQEGDEFVCGIGECALREKVMKIIENKGGRFVTLAHPSATIADSAVLGEGVVVFPYSVVSCDAAIGKGTMINMQSAIGHDSCVGAYSNIGPGCTVAGQCFLGDRVYMGTGARIVPSVKVGADAYICAGSTVMTRIRDGKKVFGTPAVSMKM